MASCYKCGGPIREVSGSLYKCQMCGAYNSFKIGSTIPSTYKVFTSFDRVKAMSIEGVYEQTKGQPGKGSADPDMIEFIQRLATKLTPIEGYTPEIQVQQLEARKDFVKQLNEVFDGNRTWDDWFNRTRTKKSLHRDDLSRMVFDSLEGLNGEGAREMRAQYEAVLNQNAFG
jgi:hypothetical protein